jgi:ABC-type branched-subunit amino acid transport system substrate-binding protein
MHRSTTGLVAVLATGALALAGCGTKGASESGGGSSTDKSGVKVGAGVTDSEITLGVMTDNSGAFKTLGLGIVQGNQLRVDDINAAGGVCGRKLKLEIVDHGYKAETAKTLYPQLAPKVAGMVQLLGSPVVAALKADLAADQLTVTPASWSSELLDSPYVMIAGTTYDVEMIDGLSYLQGMGAIKDGDTVGHVYIDSEYGRNGLAGSKFYAGKHNLTVKEAKITATDTDLTNIVTGFKSAGVKAILLTTTPTAAASAVAVDKALGMNIPVLGNNPTFAPALLKSPAKDALGLLHLVASSVPFSADLPKAKDVAAKYKAKYTEQPNAGVPYGYAVADIWGQVLTQACADKDLTRPGVQAALKKTTTATTDDLIAPLDFSKPGAPPTHKVYVAQPDAASEGGLKYVKSLFEAPEAGEYKAPHEQP